MGINNRQTRFSVSGESDPMKAINAAADSWRSGNRKDALNKDKESRKIPKDADKAVSFL